MSHVLRIATILAVCGVFVRGQSCPRSCRCDRRKSVFCNERDLVLIPYGIPVDTQTLHLQINNVTNGPITDEILSGLKLLKKLDLHQNKLTSVPKGLPSTLEYIDFRINSIKYVGKTSLRGITSLLELHLDENNITNQGLSPFAFKDTQKLKVLVLSNNLLTAFPEDLPVSLQILRLENNLIQVISQNAVERLSNLINLDLSQNAITQKKIDMGALGSLVSLRTLDLSYNHLTDLPHGLPMNLNELMLSDNRIEYIYEEENEHHGSLKRLNSLQTVDLSSNNLKSVQSASFEHLNLRSVELQDNPWQCDCHLQYLKQWLTSTESTLSSEGHIQCHTPFTYSDVTLHSIDDEALICNSRIHTRQMIKISVVSSTGFQLQWLGKEETPDPPFIKRSLMYGPLICKNCSLEGSSMAEQSLRGEATSFMENYSSQEMTAAVQSDPTNATVFVNRLQSGTHYAVCVLDSQQEDNSISTEQCIDVWTNVEAILTQSDAIFLPLWLIVLCCIIALLVAIAVVAVVVWKKRATLKTKTPRMYNGNRGELQYPADAYLPGLTRPIAYRPPPPPIQSREFGTNRTDRTYATCGPPSITQGALPDAEVDARTEFDVLIKENGTTTPKRFYTPSPTSSNSECQESNTMSTSHSGRCSSAQEQSVSPPPTYDCLHSYTPIDQRLTLINGSITPRPGHEPGSFV